MYLLSLWLLFLKKILFAVQTKVPKNLINFFYAVSKNFETEDIFKVLTALLLLQQNQSFFPFFFKLRFKKGNWKEIEINYLEKEKLYHSFNKLDLICFFYQTRNVEQKSCSWIFSAIQELGDVGEQRGVDLDFVLKPFDAVDFERADDVARLHQTVSRVGGLHDPVDLLKTNYNKLTVYPDQECLTCGM